MNLIFPSKLTAVSADKENANYPASNVIDAHPQNVWESIGNTGVLRCAVGGGADTLAIHNTNAESITVTVRALGGIDWQPGSEIDWGSELDWQTDAGDPATTVYDLNAKGVGRLWGAYTLEANPHVLEIEFTAASGTIVEAGVVDIGVGNPFLDPLQGVAQGLKHSYIIKEFNNAAVDIIVRTVVRTFGFTMTEDRDPDFNTFMDDIMQVWGPRPLSWRLCDGALTDWEWIVYGRCDPLPSGRHSLPTHSNIDVNIIEVT